MAGIPPPDYDLNEDGERVIAASKRPDGTVRKERRVRAGYVPQDEKAVYVSRGTAVRSRRCGVPPAAAAAACRKTARLCRSRLRSVRPTALCCTHRWPPADAAKRAQVPRR